MTCICTSPVIHMLDISYMVYNFTLSPHRVEAVCPRVAELNPYVHVDVSSSTLDENTDLSFLRKYQVCFCFFSSPDVFPHQIIW